MSFDGALQAPPVFRSAPRGPGGVAGPSLDHEAPSGLLKRRLRAAALFIAAIVLLMANERPGP